MALTRYEPYNLFHQMQTDLGRLFEERYADQGNNVDRSNVVTSQWSPSVDIKEEDNQYVIIADVPGVALSDVDITMDEGVLTIKGSRQWDSEDEKLGFKRVERARGAFYRRFSLPDNANQDAIEATGKDGVLTIVIPKQEKAQPRRIQISG